MRQLGLQIVLLFGVILGGFGAVAAAQTQPTQPDWSENALVPSTGRPNLYGLPDSELAETVRQGKLHALQWPVDVTASLVPYGPMRGVFEDDNHPLTRFIRTIVGGISHIHSLDEAFAWLGLHE